MADNSEFTWVSQNLHSLFIRVRDGHGEVELVRNDKAGRRRDERSSSKVLTSDANKAT